MCFVTCPTQTLCVLRTREQIVNDNIMIHPHISHHTADLLQWHCLQTLLAIIINDKSSKLGWHDAVKFLTFNVLADWIKNVNHIPIVLSRSRDIRDIRLHRDQGLSDSALPSLPLRMLRTRIT